MSDVALTHAKFSDYFNGEFADVDDLLHAHQAATEGGILVGPDPVVPAFETSVSLGYLFAAVEKATNDLESSGAMQLNTTTNGVSESKTADAGVELETTEKRVPCMHKHVQFSMLENSFTDFMMTGCCTGHQSDKSFKCTKRKIVACIVCPPQLKYPNSDKTLCMMIATSPYDATRATATHIKCPKHLFWRAVHILHEIEDCGKASTCVFSQTLKASVEECRPLFDNWISLYSAAGLMNEADGNARTRFAKAENVLTALAS